MRESFRPLWEKNMLTVDEIVSCVLTLPIDERRRLADLLEISLADDGLSAAWSEEIDRRLAAHDRGETTSVDAYDMLERVRAKLSGTV